MFFRINFFPKNTGSHTHLRFMSAVKFTQSKKQIFNQSIGPPQFKRIPLWLQWYLGFIFELFVKQIFILPHSFFGNLFTCAAFTFNLSRLGSDRLRVMMDCLSFTYVYGWHFSYLIPIKNSLEQEKDITIRFRGLQIDLLNFLTMQIQILIIMLMLTLV